MGLNLASNFLRVCLASFLLACTTDGGTAGGVEDVKKYGAVGNGRTDSTKALQQAWSMACSAEGNQQVLIPQGDYLVGPLEFKGPCKGPITFQLDGNLVAQANHRVYTRNWIDFRYITGLTIAGNGKIDGQGAVAWPHNKCPKNWNCKTLPMNFVFSNIKNATVSGISSINSKFFHMQIYASQNIDINNIKIEAPDESPNTDGIHVAWSSNVTISNSSIGTGDDCVSVGDRTTDLTVVGVTCGPGHGISVGSLGKNPGEGDVVGFTVKNCTMTGTTNGVRIKTWKSKPSTASSRMKVADFAFEDIVMNNVSNPIIIDQEYCPYAACPESSPSRVKIERVAFTNIRGTYNSDHAVKLVCSAALPCEGLVLRDINLERVGGGRGRGGGGGASNIQEQQQQQVELASSKCLNVKGLSKANVHPDPCT